MCNEKITYGVDLIALLIQIVASILMFLNSPMNKPQGSFMVNKVDVATPLKRNNKLRFGFLLLCIGFVLQMASLLMKNPFNL